MSGPKVVRVVTEEERIAICETQIALLSAAIHSLLKYLESHAIKDERLETKLRDKLAHYTKLATPEKYGEMPGLIQRELDYISSEFDQIRDKKLEESKLRQRKIRNVSESIKTLQILASSSGNDVDSSVCLKHSELSNKSDVELAEVEQTIASELSKLSYKHAKERTEANLTAEQKAIQGRLIADEGELSVSEWKLVSAELDKSGAKNHRVDAIMAELDEMAFPESRKAAYQNQLDSIYDEKSDQQRALLLDSLVINLAEESREYKRMQKARHDLLMIKAQVDVLKEESATRLSRQIDKAIESEDVSVLENMLAATTGKVAEIISARSVAQGREVLIEALKSLGYSVSEGMATAVVENGKLVVKKPAEDIYGVEVQTIAATGKFQLRLVSGLPENERSTKDDIAQEKKWCDDLAEIRKSLVESGVDLKIEKALDPGATAVKHSQIMTDMLERERQISKPGRREFDQ